MLEEQILSELKKISSLLQNKSNVSELLIRAINKLSRYENEASKMPLPKFKPGEKVFILTGTGIEETEILCITNQSYTSVNDKPFGISYRFTHPIFGISFGEREQDYVFKTKEDAINFLLK